MDHSTHNPPVNRDHHPIEGLMKTAMESIKGMIDVNTVVGQPVTTPDGSTIIPVSRVSLGFAAGGGEYANAPQDPTTHPFGGGSGAGVTVHPVGFLVVQKDHVRLLSVDRGDIWESLVNNLPQWLEQVQSWWDQPAVEGKGVTLQPDRPPSAPSSNSPASPVERGAE
jgi:sporulation protein YtfJ